MVDGDVVDAYGETTAEYRLHSVRKSLLGTLYGIALARGTADTSRTLSELGIDDDIGLTGEERSATVRHLLTGRSGIFLPATHENVRWDDVRPARGSHEPGSRWFYSNWNFNTAGTAYQIMTRESIFRAFARDVAEPIGMQDFSPEDGAWRYGSRSRHPAYVFRMSTRDLARFGQLMLDRGTWQDQRIVPDDWITEITSRHSATTTPDGRPMPGTSYGMMWWIPPVEQHGVTLGAGAVEASGTGGQLLVIAPVLDLVFVHRNDTDVPAGEYRSISTSEAYRILDLLLDSAGDLAPSAAAGGILPRG